MRLTVLHLSKADSWSFPGLAASRLHGAFQLAKLLKKACNLPIKPNTQLSFVSRPCRRVRPFHPVLIRDTLLKPIWDTFTFRQKTPVGCNTREILSVSAKFPENTNLKVLGGPLKLSRSWESKLHHLFKRWEFLRTDGATRSHPLLWPGSQMVTVCTTTILAVKPDLDDGSLRWWISGY